MKKVVYYILVALNIAMVAALLTAYLSCFMSPAKIWVFGLFGLVYSYLLTANIFFVIFWAILRKKMAIVSLVCIVIGSGFIGRNVQLVSLSKQPDNDSLKIISYNVHLLNKISYEQNGEKLNLFDFIRKSGAGIVCMQEFFMEQRGERQPQKVLEQVKTFPYRRIGSTTESTTGLAIFSNYPILRSETVFVENAVNACVYSNLKIGDDTIRVYNMHLKSIGFSKRERELLDNVLKKDYNDTDVLTAKSILRHMARASKVRAQQVDLIAKHIAQSPYPVIICGDFNDPPTSYAYQQIRGNRNDSFIEAGQGRSTTYQIGTLSSQRIDYIMYSSVFRAYDYNVPTVNFSDHQPVMCGLTKR